MPISRPYHTLYLKAEGAGHPSLPSVLGGVDFASDGAALLHGGLALSFPPIPCPLEMPPPSRFLQESPPNIGALFVTVEPRGRQRQGPGNDRRNPRTPVTDFSAYISATEFHRERRQRQGPDLPPEKKRRSRASAASN